MDAAREHRDVMRQHARNRFGPHAESAFTAYYDGSERKLLDAVMALDAAEVSP